jgi:glycosyltransferase involved in cell wall biosynthesis
MTKVSVISVFHNRARWADRTVRSLIAQDHADLEIILVDDGSTDGTHEALRNAAGDRARIVRHENMGFVAALKRAVALSTGEYVALLGSGDTCAPARLSMQARVLDERPEIGLVACGTERLDNDGGSLGHHVLPINGDASRLVTERNPFHHGELMYRRSLYDAVGGYRDFFTYAQDHDLICRMSRASHFYFVPDILYQRYAKAAGSVSASPEHVLAQRCFSHFAVRCHEECLAGRPDPLEAWGNAAALMAPPSDALTKSVRALGLWRLREGERDAARVFLEFAHTRQWHPLSLLGLASLRLTPARRPAPRMQPAGAAQ